MPPVPEECLMRWTADDVHRMIECGGFEHPERFELVEGLILEKMGQNEPHAVALELCLEAMRAVFAGVARVKAGVPLYLSNTSEPEPDVMVAVPSPGRGTRAEDVMLVVEVSDTSLRKDRTVKASLYARHGIPEYLILNVAEHRVEIHRRPNVEKETWGETLILDEEGEFTPNGANGSVRVANLFGEES